VAQLRLPAFTGRRNPARHNDNTIAVLGHLFQTFTHLPGLIRLAISGLSRCTPLGEIAANPINKLTDLEVGL
jgi:hypothetical protein